MVTRKCEKMLSFIISVSCLCAKPAFQQITNSYSSAPNHGSNYSTQLADDADNQIGSLENDGHKFRLNVHWKHSELNRRAVNIQEFNAIKDRNSNNQAAVKAEELDNVATISTTVVRVSDNVENSKLLGNHGNENNSNTGPISAISDMVLQDALSTTSPNNVERLSQNEDMKQHTKMNSYRDLSQSGAGVSNFENISQAEGKNLYQAEVHVSTLRNVKSSQVEADVSTLRNVKSSQVEADVSTLRKEKSSQIGADFSTFRVQNNEHEIPLVESLVVSSESLAQHVTKYGGSTGYTSHTMLQTKNTSTAPTAPDPRAKSTRAPMTAYSSIDVEENSFTNKSNIATQEATDSDILVPHIPLQDSVSHLLDNLMLGYDKRLRPGFGGMPLIVKTDIEIRSMGPISEKDMRGITDYPSTLKGYRLGKQLWNNVAVFAKDEFESFDERMETYVAAIDLEDAYSRVLLDFLMTIKLQLQIYSMDCYFRQVWTDSRLSFNPSVERVFNVSLNVMMLERIWRPDTIFINGGPSYVHTITTPNKFVRLYHDGTILYSQRLTIKASCPMRLEKFPMDTQQCPLHITSFGYTISDVIYEWHYGNQLAAVAANDMRLSQFDLQGMPACNVTKTFRGNQQSVLTVYFDFRRHTGYFLIQVYLPCCLLVVLSWVSFWINREATADRISLGSLTMLTMTFLVLDTRNDLPRVAYSTALDVFVLMCFCFIFASILQFAAVHFFTKYETADSQLMSVSDTDDEDEDDDNAFDSGDVLDQYHPSLEAESITGCLRKMWRCIMSTRSKRFNKNVRNALGLNSVSKIDKVARVLFPAAFLGLNIIYWMSYW